VLFRNSYQNPITRDSKKKARSNEIHFLKQRGLPGEVNFFVQEWGNRYACSQNRRSPYRERHHTEEARVVLLAFTYPQKPGVGFVYFPVVTSVTYKPKPPPDLGMAMLLTLSVF